MTDILLLILSFVLLFFGANFVLENAEKIGKKLGLSPLMIGMFIVGVGTSLPEFFVSHIAGSEGKMDMILGGLVGSNIANIALILGVCAVAIPMDMSNKEVRNQLILHLVLYILVTPLLLYKELNLFATLILGVFVLVNLRIAYAQMAQDKALIESQVKLEELEKFNWILIVGLIIVGFALLFFGGDILVKSGSNVCRQFGISEYVISSILVAFGTSFPEFVTAILSVVKKKDTDLIVGNIIGSNLFNLSFVLGSVGIYKLPITTDLTTEMIALFFLAIYMLALSIKGYRLYRMAGVMFLLIYAKMVFYWVK